jgi:hypothetical protein
MAAVALGGSIAILLAAGILAFMNFVTPEQRQKMTGTLKARAKRPFRRRAPARGIGGSCDQSGTGNVQVNSAS